MAAWRYAGLRPPLVLVAAIAVAMAVMPWKTGPPAGTVVFLDVGQGDASLIFGEDYTVLIDGGPDPAMLRVKLVEYGVDRIDLLVVTHVHADHVEGLKAVIGHMPVGEVWAAFEGHSTAASEWLVESVRSSPGLMWAPAVGERIDTPGLRLTVIAPLRRYASANDQSIVVEAVVDGRTLLFTGDIETIAQSELVVTGVDVLKVPHHGGATSTASWLRSVGADVAVISVGDNDFGHPAASVVEALESSGATVRRTDVDGDVVIGPDGLSSEHPWWRLVG
jgi:competence protein ComEC